MTFKKDYIERANDLYRIFNLYHITDAAMIRYFVLDQLIQKTLWQFKKALFKDKIKETIWKIR